MNEVIVRRVRGAFSEWQHSLVATNSKANHEKFESQQREMKEAILGGRDALVQYLRGCLRIGSEFIDAPPFPRPQITPREFPNPPIELEHQAAESWAGLIRPGEASKPLFWLLCHIAWIEEDRFGVDNLDDMFFSKAEHIDDQTRDFLRRSGGIYVRGNVTTFSDCPLARAWWLCRTVDAAADAAASAGGALNRADAHRVLHDNRPVWETLVLLSLRRITAINQPRARAALVDALIDHGKPDPEAVRRISSALARQGLSRSLEHTPWEELREIAARAARDGDDA